MQVEAAWAARHEKEAEAVYDMMLELSGLYIKSAQIMAAKNDFMPAPWVNPSRSSVQVRVDEGVLPSRRDHAWRVADWEDHVRSGPLAACLDRCLDCRCADWLFALMACPRCPGRKCGG